MSTVLFFPEDPGAEKAAHLLIRTSALVAFLILLSAVLRFVFEKKLYEDIGLVHEMSFALIASLISTALVLLIPFCGYYGSKTKNRDLILVNCICSSICAGCSGVSLMLSITAGVLGMGFPAWYAIIVFVIPALSVVVFSINAYAAAVLKSKLSVQVVVLPVAQPGIPQAVPVQPEVVEVVKQ